MLNPTELAETILGCRRRDRASQNRLYQAFHGWAWAICVRYTKEEETAYECVQDSFYKVLSKIDQFGGDLSFEAWFKKILINTCIDRYRSKINAPVYVEYTEAENLTEFAEALIDADVDYLLLLVKQLPPAYQATFNLCAIEGYDYQETADLLGVSVGSVKSNLSKARGKLKEQLLRKQNDKTNGR
jgi:RNA polymerase sigma factor (sigma-70 family)